MKHKHTHYIYASFALLLFVALGYMVKFYPEALTGFDSNIQTWVRGDLPAGLTRFFKTITILGNTPVQAIIAIVAVIWLYLRQYKSEAIFVGAIVLAQRLEKKESKIAVYAITGLLIFLVGLSRIYVGVHYPTDVLAGFTLAFGLLNAIYPTYDRIRFEWRFQSKQK